MALFFQLEIRTRVFRSEHPSVAASFNNIVNIYEKQSKYEEAFELHTKSLEIRSRIDGGGTGAVYRDRPLVLCHKVTNTRGGTCLSCSVCPELAGQCVQSNQRISCCTFILPSCAQSAIFRWRWPMLSPCRASGRLYFQRECVVYWYSIQ